MTKELPLEEKLRKSEVLTEEDIFKDFMDYAREVRDQMEIYLYMEDNKIGLDKFEYWLARFKAMRSRCQLINLVELVQQVKLFPEIQKEKIQQYERLLFNDLKSVIYTRFVGKRRANTFTQSTQKIHPSTRKIGNIEVHVDPCCRYNYYLQDFAKHIETEMKQYCNIQKEDYWRSRANLNVSFLEKKEQRLCDLAKQLLNSNKRKSMVERKSINMRISQRINLPSDHKDQDYQTPKNSTITLVSPGQNINNTSHKTSKVEKKNRSRSNSSRDSVQILKQMHEKKYVSPKFKDCEGSSHIQGIQFQFPIQKCRGKAADNEQQSGFSFGKKEGPYEQQRVFDKQKQSQKDQLKGSEKDQAFIVFSFNQDSLDKSNSIVKSEDFELELLIQDIQRERYDRGASQTFSDIDSNQQNMEVKQKLPHRLSHKRTPFAPLDDKNTNQQSSSIPLEDLIDLDDDNPQTTFLTSSSISDKKNLHQTPTLLFHSEQKRRLSHISEQQSFFSEGKKEYSAKRF